MSRDDLLRIWRANAEEIERRIAEYGGESKAPLELVNLLRRARLEIASLEGDNEVDTLRSPSERRLVSGIDYALVEIERLRRDLAAWQADLGRDLIEMAEQHIRPGEQMIYNLNTKLDAISESVRQIDVRLAVLTREVESLKNDASQIGQIARDVERLKGTVGINGDIRQPQRVYWWIVIITILVIILGIAQVTIIARGL